MVLAHIDRRLLRSTRPLLPCVIILAFYSLVIVQPVKNIFEATPIAYVNSWPEWISEEIRTGRWAAPHRGAFCPKPGDFGIAIKALPETREPERDLVRVTFEFAWLQRAYGNYIKRVFDNQGDSVRVSHRFPNGTPCRSQLVDTSFLADAERKLGRRFNAIPHPTNGRDVYRLSNPDGLPEPTKQWVSEEWHVDNFDNDGFKLMVYLTDVDENTAPFEHQEPPTLIPVLPHNTTVFQDTRLNYVGRSKRIGGEAGTAIMFKNSNVPHKGNYCRQGLRDVIVFHFVSQQ